MTPHEKHRGPTALGPAAVLAAVLGCIMTNRAHAQEAPAAVPYRPSISTPAALSAPGWVEVELGVSRAKEVEGISSQALVYALKLALSEDWGVRIAGDAFVRNAQAGVLTRGGGDTSIIIKRRFEVDERSAFGLEGGLSLPTAHSGLGSGSTDVLATGIFSSDVSDDWHVDLNLAYRRFGTSSPALGRAESSWAAAFSRSLGASWSLGVELSGARRGGSPTTSQWLMSASWAARPSVVWDVGFSRGLGQSSGSWSVFAGATFAVARLF